MPAFNGARYRKDCLDSALLRTVEDFELLIVDDGSTDETWDLARHYADRDRRITLARNESHLGLASNSDRCVRSATGEWIKFLFQDDRPEPSCLEHMPAACRRGVDLVVARRGLIFEQETPDARRSAFTPYERFNADLINLIDGEYAARIAANTGLDYVDAMLAHFRVYPIRSPHGLVSLGNIGPA